MTIRPKIGISSCLMGFKVRYNGDDKRDIWLTRELAKFVDFVPVCPEVEMGLGVPRESLRLVVGATKNEPRLVGNRTRTDFTDLAIATSSRLVERIDGLDGFVFKKKSPSCGLEKVKIYDRNEIPDARGVGVFAKHCQEKFPLMPKIEEGRLTDPSQREHFLVRIFAHARVMKTPCSIRSIQRLHQDYKLLLMAHSPKHYRELGKIAANSSKSRAVTVLENYVPTFLAALASPTTVQRRVNVLQHIAGYFRDKASELERKSAHDIISRFRNNELSFLAALTLFEHIIKTKRISYLESQLFLEPYPAKIRF